MMCVRDARFHDHMNTVIVQAFSHRAFEHGPRDVRPRRTESQEPLREIISSHCLPSHFKKLQQLEHTALS